jgi:hypothetical protein
MSVEKQGSQSDAMMMHHGFLVPDDGPAHCSSGPANV